MGDGLATFGLGCIVVAALTFGVDLLTWGIMIVIGVSWPAGGVALGALGLGIVGVILFALGLADT